MKNILTMVISTIILLGSFQVRATEVGVCNSCSSFEMRNIAKNLVDTGEVLVYDPVYQQSAKYLVFSEREGFISLKYVTPIDLLPSDIEFSLAMYHLYEKIGDSNRVSINVPMANFPSYEHTNAYDVFGNSTIRNGLSDLLTSELTNIIEGNQAAMSMLTAIAQAIAAITNYDLTLTLILLFEDGSQIVFDVSVANGMYPEHNREDSRNRDSQGNDVLNDTNSSSPNNFDFVNQSQYDDFVDAARLNGVSVSSSGNTNEGRMRCETGANKIVCTWIPTNRT